MREAAYVLHTTHPKTTFPCPICETRMCIEREDALPEFGDLEVKIHQMACPTCGLSTGRAYHPAVGYHSVGS